MSDYYQLEVPWIIVLVTTFIISGFFNEIIKRTSIMKRTKRFLIVYLSALLIVLGGVGFFSFLKMSQLNKLIVDGKIDVVVGEVSRVNSYNAKDRVFVGGHVFDINNFELYCLSGKGLFLKGDQVSIEFVDLGKVGGIIYGNCVLHSKLL